MIRFRPLPWMTALSAIGLIILVLLGNWQWRRYQEKLALRAHPAAQAVIASAVPLSGRVELVYALNDQGPLWRVFSPVAHDGVATFVDSGQISGLQAPNWRTVPEPFRGAGPIALKGVKITPHRPPWIAAKPNLVEHVWYAIDLPAMARAAGIANVTPYYVALSYVGAKGALAPNPFADPFTADPLPPERHFGYALTWWGLAAALAGVYMVFHVRAGRLGFSRKP